MAEHVEGGVHEHAALGEAGQPAGERLDVVLAAERLVVCGVGVAVEEGLELRQVTWRIHFDYIIG